MLFCHFDENKIKKTHSKLFKTFLCFYHGAVFLNVIGKRTTVRDTNMFEMTEYKKPIFQGFISSGSI